jgi:hypothetical protein
MRTAEFQMMRNRNTGAQPLPFGITGRDVNSNCERLLCHPQVPHH